jgi:Second Messenger Oligonucleotide or Dinucleotide Synthetase domain
MKLISSFNNFLTETVNLDKTRLGKLGDSVDAIYSTLRSDDEIGELVMAKIPQGSWAHKTIIKPKPGLEFDADVLIKFAEVAAWNEDPRSYRNAVDDALARSGTYKDKPRERKCRCVRLEYAGDFHVDLVPYVVHADGSETIINADENAFEPTNPRGFTAWMAEKDTIADGALRKVIRIMKYLRDHKSTFTGTRSIILTTLLGERVDASAVAADPGCYSDVPTTLVRLTEDLDAWMQARPKRPPIEDPSNSGATFDHRWSDETYRVLRDRIHAYARDFRDAYDDPDDDSSLEKWRALFGDGFGPPPAKKSGAAFGAVPAAAPSRSGRAG